MIEVGFFVKRKNSHSTPIGELETLTSRTPKGPPSEGGTPVCL